MTDNRKILIAELTARDGAESEVRAILAEYAIDVTSRHVTSRHVTSRHVTSCHVMSCHVMSRPSVS